MVLSICTSKSHIPNLMRFHVIRRNRNDFKENRSIRSVRTSHVVFQRKYFFRFLKTSFEATNCHDFCFLPGSIIYQKIAFLAVFRSLAPFRFHSLIYFLNGSLITSGIELCHYLIALSQYKWAD